MIFNKLFEFHDKDENEFKIKKCEPIKRKTIESVSSYLFENEEYLDYTFSKDKSYDIEKRKFKIKIGRFEKDAFLYFIDGLISRDSVNENILSPLMVESVRLGIKDFSDVENILFTQNQVRIFDKFDDVIKDVCYGSCALFIEGENKALMAQVIGFPTRSVDSANNEPAILGANEAFTETIKTNTSILRKMIRSEHLNAETVLIGEKGKTVCAFMYMDNIANPTLIDEVRRRLSLLKVDHILSSSELMQFIEDNSFISLPQMVLTERPDRCARAITEGKVVIIVDNSPLAIILPTNVFELIESAEDIYLRPPYSLITKITRMLGVFMAIYLPGIYIATITYHTTIIPTGMLTTIMQGSRRVPFDSVTELLIMVAAFEIIREANSRVPSILGGSLGIIGPLVLGQAAISANIVSPIMLIIFSLSTIGSFAIPNYTMTFSSRVLNLIYIVLGSAGGFLGILSGFFVQVVLWHGVKSFGVPMLLPFDKNIVPEAVKVKPIWKKENRPAYLKPLSVKSQAHISRLWKK